MTTFVATSAESVHDTPARSRTLRLVWKIGGCLLALVIVLALVESLVTATADEKIPNHERIFTSNVSRINVNTANGSITVVGDSRSATYVTSSGTRGLVTPSDSERIHDGTLTIQSVCASIYFNNNCNRSYVIHVPADATVNARTGQGDIVVSGVNSAETLHTGQGDLVVSGRPLSLWGTTDQGSVNGNGLSSKSVYVNSGQGDIYMSFTSPPTVATVLTEQGSVYITVPKGPDLYDVMASTDQGSRVVDVPQDTESHRLIKASTLQGNVFVRYDNSAGQ
jgi:DUF4097 and DUF4098 domain-containing protein YvlB